MQELFCSFFHTAASLAAPPWADLTLMSPWVFNPAVMIKSLAAGAGLCQATSLDPHAHPQAAAGRVAVRRWGYAHLRGRQAGQGHTHRHAPL